MARPELVESRLGDEEVVATVDLSGEDTLVVTPTRSLLYRSEGLISDESVEEYPHEARRLTLNPGRRKVKLRFEYPIQDARTMSIPSPRLDGVLHYVLAGVLNARGVTEEGESVRRLFRFNEMTLVITDRRLVTHVGAAVWDEDFDQYPYDDLTGLEFEEGSVATQVVLYMGGRSQRIKAPHDRAEELKQELTRALVGHFDVKDLAELDEVLRPDDEDEADSDDDATGLNLVGSIQRSDGDAESDTSTEELDPPVDLDALQAAITQLERAIEEQRELLAAQSAALESLTDAVERE